MFRIIELGGSVFEVRIEPDEPGWRRRTCSIEQLSGPDYTLEQWQAAVDALVAKLEASGIIVHSISYLEKRP